MRGGVARRARERNQNISPGIEWVRNRLTYMSSNRATTWLADRDRFEWNLKDVSGASIRKINEPTVRASDPNI